MDEVGGLYFAQARRYDAQIGRFVSEDKVRGFVVVPYTLNHYGYCWNDPEDYIDRDGNFAILATMAIGAGVGALASGVWEAGSQVVQGLSSGKGLVESLGEVDVKKVFIEAGKGAISGLVAGTGAGLGVMAATSLVTEFGGSVVEEIWIEGKTLKEVDYVEAGIDGMVGFCSTLVIGGITNKVTSKISTKLNIKGEVSDYVDAIDDKAMKLSKLQNAIAKADNYNVKNVKSKQWDFIKADKYAQDVLVDYTELTVAGGFIEKTIEGLLNPVKDGVSTTLNDWRCPAAA